MPWSWTTRGLVLLALLALCLRVAAVFVLGSYREPFTYEHGEIAENLLAGRGFSVTFLGTHGPTSQQAPLYPALLAAAYWLFGVKSPAAFLAIQLLQCLAGAATAVCTAWLAWSVFGVQYSVFSVQRSEGARESLPPASCLLPPGPVGWLAGLIAAVHPAHIYVVTHIQVAPWATLLLTLLVAVGVSPRWRGRWSGAVLIGLIGGMALLFEPIFVLAMPVVGLTVSGRRGWGLQSLFEDMLKHDLRRLRGIALTAAVTLAVIAPWLWRNCRVHGEFVLIKSTFGYALWQGNNPISWGTDKVPKPSAEELRLAHDGSPVAVHRAAWEARHETLYIDDVLIKPTGYREFAGLTEPQRCRLLGGRARQFIIQQPGDYVRLCGSRLRYFLLWDETNPKAANVVYRATTIAWLMLCVAGLWLTWRRWRGLWPTYAVFGVIMLFHVLTIMSARFRIPLEPLTFVWAAASLSYVISRVCRPVFAHYNSL